jgi:serine/threonine protein kinase
MNRRVGRYVIERELGSGGTAIVYLARQLDLDRLVALKELGAVRKDPAFVRRFLRESRLAASLAHPNIVTVHDYFEQGGTPYIAMEYVAGGSLRPHIGRLSLAQIGGVLAGVLAGLAHAERRGIVHRDLKPENLLVTEDGQVKITDFGIAKAISAAQTAGGLTAAGTTLGTPNYMAPEQAMGQEVGPVERPVLRRHRRLRDARRPRAVQRHGAADGRPDAARPRAGSLDRNGAARRRSRHL